MKKHTARRADVLARYAIVTSAALLLVLLFHTVIAVNQTTVALSFLVLVLVTASRWRLAYSVYASVLCTLLYNFFFLPPVGRFTIQDPQNWVAMTAFLCTSVLVSHLAERERQQAENSEARREEVERLYEFSQQLLLQEDSRALTRALPSLAATVFSFGAVALYVRAEDELYSSDPQSQLVHIVDLKLALGQSEAATATHGYRLIPLSLGMRSLGALAVTEDRLSPQMYEAIGTLVAIALERAAALERSSRLEASRQSEALRAALLDSVTHDLRTPLTSIRAAATTLVSTPDLLPAERAELAAVVDEESARLDRLIGQAMEMAQLDAEAVKIQARPQDIRELIGMTLEQVAPLLRDRSVTVEVSADLPPVPMDRAMIHRVLRHLMENALKYSPPLSPIEICASRDEYRLLITVADRGPGVEPDEQPFVFDKFFRGKRQRTRAAGTGMGLAIARAIVEAHRGGIAVANGQDGGSRFTIWLPLTAEQVGAGRAAPAL